jgi:hypothetical protein
VIVNAVRCSPRLKAAMIQHSESIRSSSARLAINRKGLSSSVNGNGTVDNGNGADDDDSGTVDALASEESSNYSEEYNNDSSSTAVASDDEGLKTTVTKKHALKSSSLCKKGEVRDTFQSMANSPKTCMGSDRDKQTTAPWGIGKLCHKVYI